MNINKIFIKIKTKKNGLAKQSRSFQLLKCSNYTSILA